MARDSITNEDSEAVKTFLANGGKITYCKPFERTNTEDVAYTHGWGRKKKVVETPKDVDKSTD